MSRRARGSAPRPPRGTHRSGSRLAAGGGSLATLAALALVAALVAAAHWPVLRAQALSLDDGTFVVNNPLVTRPGWGSVVRFFTEVTQPSTVRGYYLPLSMTSLMLDHAAGGRPSDLGAFHRTSLALHVLAAVLVTLLLWRLFGALFPATLAGLLFGLHPLTVEPIAWIGERKTLLAAVFALASLVCYVRSVRSARGAWSAASLGLFVLALLSKPTVAPLPVLLVLLDVWPLGRLRVRTMLEKWPFFLIALVSGVVTLISHERTAGIGAVAAGSLLQWSVHAGYLLGFYLVKIVWPVHLSCVYPSPVPFDLSNPAVLGGVLGTAALAVALLLLARRARGPLVGAAWFVVALAPTLGLVEYSWVIASDKYVYFPALGILMVVAGGLAWLWRSPRTGSPAGRAVLLLSVLLVLVAETRGTRAALSHWHDTLSLCHQLVAVAPEAPSAHVGLGAALLGQGEHDGATREFRRAIELAPGFPDAHLNLALALDRQGRHREAEEHLRRAVRHAPRWADPLNELAWLLATCPDVSVCDPAEAMQLAGRAAEITARRDPNVLDTQAAAQAAAGRFDQATATARQALGLAGAYGSGALADSIRVRLALYERGIAYVRPGTDSTSRR